MEERTSDRHRAALMSVARQALGAHLLGTAPGDASSSGPEQDAGSEISLFVTLRNAQDLRGCIGLVEVRSTLEEAVAQCAVAAATDPRFDPLEAAELDDISIEISILTRSRPVSHADQIRVGIDGVKVEQGLRRGLFLPKVAVDQGWTARELAREVCRKAGLPPDAWEGDAVLQVFQAEVFEEKFSPAGPGDPGPAEPE